MNRYNPTSGKFTKGEKGWRTTRSSKPYLLSILKSFTITYKDILKLPNSLLDEFLTFHESSYTDDEVIAYGLAIVAYQLLDKYREFLIETKQFNNSLTNTELDDIPIAVSSQFTGIVSEEEIEHGKVKADKLTDLPTTDLIKMEIQQKKDKLSNKKQTPIQNSDEKKQRNLFGRFLSRVTVNSSDVDDIVF
jgi:hypothetical protein